MESASFKTRSDGLRFLSDAVSSAAAGSFSFANTSKDDSTAAAGAAEEKDLVGPAAGTTAREERDRETPR